MVADATFKKCDKAGKRVDGHTAHLAAQVERALDVHPVRRRRRLLQRSHLPRSRHDGVPHPKTESSNLKKKNGHLSSGEVKEMPERGIR